MRIKLAYLICFICVCCLCNQVDARSTVINRCRKFLHIKEKEVPVNLMPKTYEEYLEQSADKKIYEQEIPEPVIPRNEKLVNEPNPDILLEKYNYPAGSRVIDISKLKEESHIARSGVAAPAGDKMVYSELYYDKVNKRVSSEIYTILNTDNLNMYNFLKNSNVVNRINIPILTSGVQVSAFNQQSILTPLDWSSDGNMIAIKETIGNNNNGIWKTNLWVYDYRTGSAKELFELRQAIINYWLEHKRLNLNDYMWDIYPLGWDSENNDSLVVAAYAEEKDKKPFFLGEWIIECTGNAPSITSSTKLTRTIQANGMYLKFGPKY